MTPLSALHDFTGGLSPEIRAALDAASTRRELPAGASLLRAGVVPREVFQIV